MYIWINDIYANQQEMFEDAKGVIRSRKKGHIIQWQKQKGQKDKQRSTKYYIENKGSNNTIPTKSWG